MTLPPGCFYRLSGRVIHGAKLGRTLGYPTANIDPNGAPESMQGIYAVQVNSEQLLAVPGIASLGTRPTINSGSRLLEVHLFDFGGDLYGHHLHVDFVAHLRDEVKFSDIDALKVQMRLDEQAAREILAATPKRG